MEYDLITVAETEPFQRKAGRLLTENEKSELVAYLAMHPNAGALIKGTGGIRKLRWARSGMGKSGGVRVIYYFHSEKMPLYLLTLFGKSEKSDISLEEKNALSKSVERLVKYWRQII
ncbi:MAG: type II toxin-antitoxin system RelE/ParE family toxin [Lysobacterales bacterium]